MESLVKCTVCLKHIHKNDYVKHIQNHGILDEKKEDDTPFFDPWIKPKKKYLRCNLCDIIFPENSKLNHIYDDNHIYLKNIYPNKIRYDNVNITEISVPNKKTNYLKCNLCDIIFGTKHIRAHCDSKLHIYHRNSQPCDVQYVSVKLEKQPNEDIDHKILNQVMEESLNEGKQEVDDFYDSSKTIYQNGDDIFLKRALEESLKNVPPIQYFGIKEGKQEINDIYDMEESPKDVPLNQNFGIPPIKEGKQEIDETKYQMDDEQILKQIMEESLEDEDRILKQVMEESLKDHSYPPIKEGKQEVDELQHQIQMNYLLDKTKKHLDIEYYDSDDDFFTYK